MRKIELHRIGDRLFAFQDNNSHDAEIVSENATHVTIRSSFGFNPDFIIPKTYNDLQRLVLPVLSSEICDQAMLEGIFSEAKKQRKIPSFIDEKFFFGAYVGIPRETAFELTSIEDATHVYFVANNLSKGYGCTIPMSDIGSIRTYKRDNRSLVSDICSEMTVNRALGHMQGRLEFVPFKDYFILDGEKLPYSDGSMEKLAKAVF